MAEAVALWRDRWPAGSPWRRYFTEDSERWSNERICPECRELVQAEDEQTCAARIGGLRFVFHEDCYQTFASEAEERPIDWGHLPISGAG